MAEMALSSFSRLLSMIHGDDVASIQVGDDGESYALVDKLDAPRIGQHKWRLAKGYAVTTVDHVLVQMHSMIMGFREGLIVDHEDRDPLNNQRYNLRWATHAENMRNRMSSCGKSKFKGVVPTKSAWIAQIKSHGKKHYLGAFASERRAAMAYDQAAIRLHGEFACTNRSMGLL